MKAVWAIIAVISISVAMDSAPAQAGILATASVLQLKKAQAPRIIAIDWGHHHCWWIRGRRVCRK